MGFSGRARRPGYSPLIYPNGIIPYGLDQPSAFDQTSGRPLIRGALGADAMAGQAKRAAADSAEPLLWSGLMNPIAHRTGTSPTTARQGSIAAGPPSRAIARAATPSHQGQANGHQNGWTARLRKLNAPSIKRPWTNDVPLGTEELGFVSAWREGGKKDVLSIANDQTDPGKGGYGPWQLSTDWGMPAFLRSKWGKPYASSFGSARPGTNDFNRHYKAVAARDGTKFRQAQHDYLYNEFYVPVANHARESGFDLRNQGIREAIFSLVVQHRHAKLILDRVVAANEQQGDPTKVIAAIYGKRMEYVAGLETLPLEQKKEQIERYKKEGRQILLHDALVCSQDLVHQDLIDLSNPRNYPGNEVPK